MAHEILLALEHSNTVLLEDINLFRMSDEGRELTTAQKSFRTRLRGAIVGLAREHDPAGLVRDEMGVCIGITFDAFSIVLEHARKSCGRLSQSTGLGPTSIAFMEEIAAERQLQSNAATSPENQFVYP